MASPTISPRTVSAGPAIRAQVSEWKGGEMRINHTDRNGCRKTYIVRVFDLQDHENELDATDQWKTVAKNVITYLDTLNQKPLDTLSPNPQANGRTKTVEVLLKAPDSPAAGGAPSTKESVVGVKWGNNTFSRAELAPAANTNKAEKKITKALSIVRNNSNPSASSSSAPASPLTPAHTSSPSSPTRTPTPDPSSSSTHSPTPSTPPSGTGAPSPSGSGGVTPSPILPPPPAALPHPELLPIPILSRFLNDEKPKSSRPEKDASKVISSQLEQLGIDSTKRWERTDNSLKTVISSDALRKGAAQYILDKKDPIAKSTGPFVRQDNVDNMLVFLGKFKANIAPGNTGEQMARLKRKMVNGPETPRLEEIKFGRILQILHKQSEGTLTTPLSEEDKELIVKVFANVIYNHRDLQDLPNIYFQAMHASFNKESTGGQRNLVIVKKDAATNNYTIEQQLGKKENISPVNTIFILRHDDGTYSTFNRKNQSYVPLVDLITLPSGGAVRPAPVVATPPPPASTTTTSPSLTTSTPTPTRHSLTSSPFTPTISPSPSSSPVPHAPRPRSLSMPLLASTLSASSSPSVTPTLSTLPNPSMPITAPASSAPISHPSSADISAAPLLDVFRSIATGSAARAPVSTQLAQTIPQAKALPPVASLTQRTLKESAAAKESSANYPYTIPILKDGNCAIAALLDARVQKQGQTGLTLEEQKDKKWQDQLQIRRQMFARAIKAPLSSMDEDFKYTLALDIREALPTMQARLLNARNLPSNLTEQTARNLLQRAPDLLKKIEEKKELNEQDKKDLPLLLSLYAWHVSGNSQYLDSSFFQWYATTRTTKIVVIQDNKVLRAFPRKSAQEAIDPNNCLFVQFNFESPQHSGHYQSVKRDDLELQEIVNAHNEGHRYLIARNAFLEVVAAGEEKALTSRMLQDLKTSDPQGYRTICEMFGEDTVQKATIGDSDALRKLRKQIITEGPEDHKELAKLIETEILKQA